MVGFTEKAFIGLLALFLVFAALLFGGAGTFEWWQAWVFLTVYFGASIALTLYLVKSDPALLGRRLRGGPWAEKQPAQRVVMLIASVAFIGLILVPGLDRRFGWSTCRRRWRWPAMCWWRWAGSECSWCSARTVSPGDDRTGA